MIALYALCLTPAEFRWLRAWINAGVSVESEGASITKKLDSLADLDKPKSPERKAA